MSIQRTKNITFPDEDMLFPLEGEMLDMQVLLEDTSYYIRVIFDTGRRK